MLTSFLYFEGATNTMFDCDVLVLRYNVFFVRVIVETMIAVINVNTKSLFFFGAMATISLFQ